MITITSYLHRAVLNDVILRWMYDDARPSDADLVTRLVNFNSIYVYRYIQHFSHWLFHELHQTDLHSRRAALKGDLKDIITLNPPCRTTRVNELITNYHSYPERFYRETPFHATLFFIGQNGAERYVGSNRIKRVRRLAEKGSRRIIDRIFTTIKKRADELAEDRARRLGIPHQQLLTRPEDMISEFLRAEGRLLDDLRRRRHIQNSNDLMINDVAGLKVILESERHFELMALLRRSDNCDIIEEEPHTGRYNATNLIVRYRPPKEHILNKSLGENLLQLMQAHGMNQEQVNREFAEFVRTGEDGVYIELIVSNYQEMLESEIGRCMHEDRIIEQRMRQEYRGHLSKNVEYLMEYLFAFPSSTRKDLGTLPIKLWTRYLPDYFDEVIKGLFDIPPGQIFD
jgi:hypothetical protein